jgi:NCS1 family nucleobase:cation symporter-1
MVSHRRAYPPSCYLIQDQKHRLVSAIKKKTTKDGWVTEKHTSPYSESNIWMNKDNDITPLEQRTWTMLGFWISDSLSAQGWEGAASIIAVGLTWYTPPS